MNAMKMIVTCALRQPLYNVLPCRCGADMKPGHSICITCWIKREAAR